MLQEKLGDEFAYSEYYNNGKALENSPEITAQKTHDFDLDCPKQPEYIHIVQCRVVEDCIKSWEILDANFPNKQKHYGDFVSKWIVAPVPNRLIVYYHDLLESTDEWVNTVISCIK
jgi:hypothetical protein